MHATLKSVRELPEFPERADGLTDHEYVAQAARLGPVVRDRFGILVTFSHENLLRLNDTAITRQMELETMRLRGIESGPIYDFFANTLLFSNDPRHKARRTPIARTFARPLMEALRPDIRELARTLVEPLVGRPEVDFLKEVSGPLPARVIAGILGAPEADIPYFTRLVYSAIRALSLRSDEVLAEAGRDLAELNKYVEGLLADARADDRGGFLADYLSRTAGSDLSPDEIRMQIVSLVIAGADTTRIALASTFAQLVSRPEQWSQLRADPEGMKQGAASEGLRYEPVIAALSRVATCEFELEGVHIQPGTVLAPSVIAALRDPAVYAEPDRFDIERTDHPRWHPVFGAGAHRCLGEALARAEIEETLCVLAQLSETPALVGPAPRLHGMSATRSISPMTVRL